MTSHTVILRSTQTTEVSPMTVAPQPSMPLLVVPAIALVDSDGRILLSKRPENKPMAGLWEFPGGKIEPGETAEQCLKRELEEELSIISSVGSKVCTTEWVREDKIIVLHTYEIISFKGEIRANAHADLQWLLPSEIDRSNLLPADRPILDILRS